MANAWRPSLAQMHRVSKPGGRLLLVDISTDPEVGPATAGATGKRGEPECGRKVQGRVGRRGQHAVHGDVVQRQHRHPDGLGWNSTLVHRRINGASWRWLGFGRMLVG
jgi:hypothetical protein